METLKVLILGLEQGITELLPISSSAHLLVTSQIIDIEMDTYFLSVLHLGTTVALILHFFNFLFKEIFSKVKLSIYLKIIISTIPAGIIGFFFESVIEQNLRGNLIISLSLIFWGIVMIIIERKHSIKEQDLQEITWKQSLAMGLGQIFAFIPGGSRSGISTIFGVFTGVNKYTALQYSFLLGMPLLFVAPIYVILKEYPERTLNTQDLVGILVAGIVTYLSISLIKKFSKRNWLTFFGIYRIIFGLSILFFLL